VKRVVLPNGGRPVIVDSGSIHSRFHWSGLFGNKRPVEVEVGFGKGRFLIETAASRPVVNFLGIEVARKYLDLVAWRILQRGLTNVKLIHEEAEAVFRHRIASGTVDACYIFFPDPWPKKRHHKRRLLQRPFIDDVASSLVPGGRLHFVTDFKDYYEAALPFLQEHPELEPVDREPADIGAEDLVLGGYELKYLEQGRSIYRTVWAKSPLAEEFKADRIETSGGQPQGREDA